MTEQAAAPITPAAMTPEAPEAPEVPEAKAGPQVEETATEILESLSGFEEIAISEAFGRDITTLADVAATIFIRALIFIVKTRDGVSKTDAKNQALTMRLGDAQSFFTPEPDDAMPDDPDSPAGKDSSANGSGPKAKPTSVSSPG